MAKSKKLLKSAKAKKAVDCARCEVDKIIADTTKFVRDMREK